MTMTILVRSGALLALFAATLSGQQQPPKSLPAAPSAALAKAPPAVQAAAERYAVADWPRSDRRAGVRLDTVEIRELTGREIESAEPFRTNRRYGDPQADRLEIDVHVRDSVDAAQCVLLGWLANTSRPDAVPTAAKEGMPVGDIGYVGWSRPAERRLSWLAFVRGNVAVRVHCFDPSADPHPDLVAIAQAVDAAIRREAPLAEKAGLPAPAIAAFATAKASCVEGDVVPVTLTVRDDAGVANVRFQFDGPGQAYVEGDSQKGFVLHTTGAGPLTVRVFVTNRCGVTAESLLRLSIDARR